MHGDSLPFSITLRMRLARTRSTVGTRLIARETVAIDTLANRATSTSVILLVIVSDTVNEYHLRNSTPLLRADVDLPCIL